MLIRVVRRRAGLDSPAVLFVWRIMWRAAAELMSAHLFVYLCEPLSSADSCGATLRPGRRSSASDCPASRPQTAAPGRVVGRSLE